MLFLLAFRSGLSIGFGISRLGRICFTCSGASSVGVLVPPLVAPSGFRPLPARNLLACRLGRGPKSRRQEQQVLLQWQAAPAVVKVTVASVPKVVPFLARKAGATFTV